MSEPRMCEHGIHDCLYCEESRVSVQALNLQRTALPSGQTLLDTLAEEMDHYARANEFTSFAVKAREWASRLRSLNDER